MLCEKMGGKLIREDSGHVHTFASEFRFHQHKPKSSKFQPFPIFLIPNNRTVYPKIDIEYLKQEECVLDVHTFANRVDIPPTYVLTSHLKSLSIHSEEIIIVVPTLFVTETR